MAFLHGNGHGHSHSQVGPATKGATIRWAAMYNFLFGNLLRKSDQPLAQLAAVQPGYTVLDAGCGPGNLSRTLEKLVGPTGQVCGIDAAPEMIEVAQQQSAQRQSQVKFQVGLFEALPFPDQKFDVVVSRLVIHHLPPELRPTAFAEVRRVLKPGGQFFIVDFKMPKSRLMQFLLRHLPAIRPMLQINIKNYVPLLETAGFKKIEVGETGFDMLAFVRGWTTEHN